MVAPYIYIYIYIYDISRPRVNVGGKFRTKKQAKLQVCVF